jgi:integrase
VTLDTISPNIGNALIELWRRREYAVGTMYLRRKYLKQLLRHLVDCGANRAILGGLTRIRQPKPRDVIATDAELQALRKHAKGWLACWLEIAAGHGLRFTETRRLAAVHFNEAQGTICYPTKGADFNQLPATATLQNFFSTAPASADPHEPLIERIAGHTLSPDMIRDAWKKLLAAAGITRPIWPHDLRRTLAVRTMNATHDIRDAQHILGHQSLATTAHYLAHRDPDKLRPLLEELRKWTPAAGEPTQ